MSRLAGLAGMALYKRPYVDVGVCVRVVVLFIVLVIIASTPSLTILKPSNEHRVSSRGVIITINRVSDTWIAGRIVITFTIENEYLEEIVFQGISMPVAEFTYSDGSTDALLCGAVLYAKIPDYIKPGHSKTYEMLISNYHFMDPSIVSILITVDINTNKGSYTLVYKTDLRIQDNIFDLRIHRGAPVPRQVLEITRSTLVVYSDHVELFLNITSRIPSLARIESIRLNNITINVTSDLAEIKPYKEVSTVVYLNKSSINLDRDYILIINYRVAGSELLLQNVSRKANVIVIG